MIRSLKDLLNRKKNVPQPGQVENLHDLDKLARELLYGENASGAAVAFAVRNAGQLSCIYGDRALLSSHYSLVLEFSEGRSGDFLNKNFEGGGLILIRFRARKADYLLVSWSGHGAFVNKKGLAPLKILLPAFFSLVLYGDSRKQTMIYNSVLADVIRVIAENKALAAEITSVLNLLNRIPDYDLMAFYLERQPYPGALTEYKISGYTVDRAYVEGITAKLEPLKIKKFSLTDPVGRIVKREAIIYPLRIRELFMGSLLVVKKEEGEISAWETSYFGIIARVMSLYLKKVDNRERADREKAVKEFLTGICASVSSGEDIRGVIRRAVKTFRQVSGAWGVVVCFEDGEGLEPAAVDIRGYTAAYPLPAPDTDIPAIQDIKSGGPVILRSPALEFLKKMLPGLPRLPEHALYCPHEGPRGFCGFTLIFSDRISSDADIDDSKWFLNVIGLLLACLSSSVERKYNLGYAEALKDIAFSAGKAGDPGSLLDSVSPAVFRFTKINRLSLAFASGGDQLQMYTRPEQEPGEYPDGKTIDRAGTPVASVLESGERIICNRLSVSSDPLMGRFKDEGFNSFAVFPLLIKGKCAGTLNAGSRRSGEFTSTEIALLEYAAEIISLKLPALMPDNGRAGSSMFIEALELLDTAVFISGRHGEIVYANKNFMELFGTDMARLREKKCQDIFSNGKKYCRHLEPDSPVKNGMNVERLAGRYFYVYARAFRRPSEMAGGSVHFCTDISDNVKKMQKLLQAEKLGVVTSIFREFPHHINNMLNNISGCLYLLKNDTAGRNKTEYITVCDAELQRCVKMVQDFMVFSDDFRLEKKEVNMVPLLEGLLGSFEGRNLMQDVSFIRKYAPSFYAGAALDPEKAAIALKNILQNTLDALYEKDAGAGQKKVALGIKRLSGGRTAVTVADNGTGMEPEDLQNVFIPFFSTRNSRDRIGLGLTIAYGILYKHGASVSMRSRKGSGTVFRIIFPGTSR